MSTASLRRPYVHNYAVTHNWMISNHLSNQLLAGVNYFGQTFNDSVLQPEHPCTRLECGPYHSEPVPELRPLPLTPFDQVGVAPP